MSADRSLSSRYGVRLFAFMVAAVLTGVACVFFARMFDVVVHHRADLGTIGGWAWLVTPLGFLVAVESIRRLAPFAAGTGIPQAVFAAEHMSAGREKDLLPLVSWRTMAVKVGALLAGVAVGASTGREGPTVHIAVCVFLGLILLIRRWTGVSLDLRSAVIAGGAAGLAAAFNTPLAGVTFAVEELSGDYFSSVKDIVLMAIIVAAITAKSMTGEYSYFGHLPEPAVVFWRTIIAIGLLAGAAGAGFSTVLLRGSGWVKRLDVGPGRYLVPIVMALAVVAVSLWADTRVLGPGNQAAQDLLSSGMAGWAYGFPLAKAASTLFTYWSGIAGGIFAPCLSIGAAMGASMGTWLSAPAATCALLGMAAFLSGAIQAPITSFVIIFEMTGHHQMLLPIMLVSLLAFMVARLLGAAHLYQTLAASYGVGRNPHD